MSLSGTHFFKRHRDGRPVATCDRCGMAYPYGRLRFDWQGLFVCSGADTADCWEPMHPQLNFNAPTDNSLSMPNPRVPREATGLIGVDSTLAPITPTPYNLALAQIRARGLPS